MVACGSNAFCQLSLEGSELMTPALKLVSIPTPKGARSEFISNINCGSNMSCVIASAGESETCFLWGSGLPGTSLRVPTPLTVKEVIQVSCGPSHVGLITSDKKLYTWGSGENGK